ncbi:hypothetical protein GCM10027026_26440 [Myroides odoratimimus subsp. xuanwuensis]
MARGGWEGSAADGYQAFTRPVVRATDQHVQRIGRAATAIEDYAARLRQMKRTMTGLRTRAENGGLTVAGTVIQAPPAVPAGPVVKDSPEEAARQTAVDKITLYNTLVEEATTASTDFADWIETHLSADLKDAQEKDTVDKVLTELEAVIPNFAAGVGAGLTGLALMKKASQYAAERREFRRRSRAARKPGVRGQADTPAGRAHVDDLATKARRLGRFGRFLGGPVGIGIDIGFGIKDGIETGDWTRAALTTGTSIAVGVGAAALVAAGVVTAPAWLTVVGAGALAAGAAWGVGKIYDNWDDITDWGGDRVDDVKDFATDTWDKASDVVGDTWDAVTPW